MHWTYADVGALPAHVYDVLVTMLNDDDRRQRDAAGDADDDDVMAEYDDAR